jgi:hypothetical protein
MTPDDNSIRQKFLLGLTLSEISFIYFIIILLISLSYFIDYKKEKKVIVAEVEKLKEENSSLQSSLDVAYDEIDRLSNRLGLSEKEKERNFHDREMDRRKFKEEQKKLKIAKEKYDEILEKHEDLKLDKDNMNPIGILEKFSEIKKQLEEFGTDNDSVDDKISDLVANASKYDSQKEELEKLRKDLELAEKETTDKKGEGDGHGPPPCFFTESEDSKRLDKKKEDYMYKIYVHKNKFVMEPNWKAKDKEQMEEIWNLIKVDKVLYSKSRASSRKKFTLSIQEFDKFGKIIKDHGEANKCKHYAVVERSFKVKKDGVPDGMAYMAWDENFKIIDDYFYSYCPPCLRK